MPKATNRRRGVAVGRRRGAAGRGLDCRHVRPLPLSAFGTKPGDDAARGHHPIWVITRCRRGGCSPPTHAVARPLAGHHGGWGFCTYHGARSERRTPAARAAPGADRATGRRDSAQLVTLVAPAGYGKTSLLCDWAAEDARPFAWVTLDREHNDPACLENSLTVALAGHRARRRRARPRRPPHGAGARGAGRARRARRALPPEVTRRIASRPPPLPVARMRAQGRLVELGPPELAMDVDEAAQLVRRAGLDLDAAECVELWPRRRAGRPLSRSAPWLGDHSRAEPADFGGADRLVAEYVRDEILAGLPPDGTASCSRRDARHALGALCDHVLERAGSAAASRRSLASGACSSRSTAATSASATTV